MAFGHWRDRDALAAKAITLHTKIRRPLQTVDAAGSPVTQLHETTPGRMLLADLFAAARERAFALVNKADDQEGKSPT